MRKESKEKILEPHASAFTVQILTTFNRFPHFSG
jgi:hypothetical protein